MSSSHHHVTAALSAMCLRPFAGSRTVVKLTYRRKAFAQLTKNFRTLRSSWSTESGDPRGSDRPECNEFFHILAGALSPKGPQGFWGFFETSPPGEIPDFARILGSDLQNFQRDCEVFGGAAALQLFHTQDRLTSFCREFVGSLPPVQKPCEIHFFYDNVYKATFFFHSRRAPNLRTTVAGRWGKWSRPGFDKVSVSFTLLKGHTTPGPGP
jgi:hypothetical protein